MSFRQGGRGRNGESAGGRAKSNCSQGRRGGGTNRNDLKEDVDGAGTCGEEKKKAGVGPLTQKNQQEGEKAS